MSSNLSRCAAQALKLSPEERASLAEQLLASLHALDSAENERLWVAEAERRYRAYKTGKVRSRPAREAIRAARAKISGRTP